MTVCHACPRGLLSYLCSFLLLGFVAALPARAALQEFDLPAQPVAAALLAFSQQAKIEVLFSADELRSQQSTAVMGRHEPAKALVRLLQGTGLTARQNPRGKFIITPLAPETGSISGRVLAPDGRGLRSAIITLASASDGTVRATARSDSQGKFVFSDLPTGDYGVLINYTGFQSLQLNAIGVVSGNEFVLEPRTLQPLDELTQLETFVVQGKLGQLRPFARSRDALPPRTALGNVDLVRTENDALPFSIYDREQILRSGVVGLNEFLQREVLEGSAGTPPPGQNTQDEAFKSGSTNLNLRGYDADETIILVNGRRLPEMLTIGAGPNPPDVDLIPLSLVQQVQVLPASASALYTGNPVGGVINIVLRPDLDATEISTTYTNTTGGYDAPQSSISLQHGQSYLEGKLHLRLSTTFSHASPPNEAELGYRAAILRIPPSVKESLHRATPNIKSTDGTPLFGPGTATMTSVAPGADGTGGLTSFTGRQGVRSLDLFETGGGLSASPFSRDYSYGREQRRRMLFGSVVYDVLPWLQIGLDGTSTQTTIHRGYDLIAGDLTLKAGSPQNPFGQAIDIALLESAPALGQNYNEARLSYTSTVLGLLVKLPEDWRVSADVQYANNLVRYRGLAGTNGENWQKLVDEGKYQPLRDTQAYGPPKEFYDQVLIYRGGRGQFVTLGDFDTLDAAIRLSNQKLALPTGQGALNLGGDYRRTHLAGFVDERRFGDGTPAAEAQPWSGRTLQRLSVFGELQAPLLSARRLPGWLKNIEADVAVRYIAADNANETNLAPTYGLKTEFAGGLSFRGSITTANRLPTPQMSRPIAVPSGPGSSGISLSEIFDPRRNNESYGVRSDDAVDPNLLTEGSVTQTAGLVFQRGKIHRWRAALDFVDTHKQNEVVWLDAQTLVNTESFFPERIVRATPGPADPGGVGRILSLVTGPVNVGNRHSQNWTLACDYAWSQCLGGTLELYSRWLYFARYDRQVYAESPVVDEINAPDGLASNLLKYRVKLGAAWSTPQFGFGMDGQYFHSRVLPASDWIVQGGREVNPYWQVDAYVQSDLSRWLPWKNSRHALRGQLRVNNVFAQDFPKFVNDPSGARVQPYGDWRGRVYSLSLTASF